ncbi:hypothetical protein AKO1_007747 [Acrasis kona]|uniref:Lipid-binding serum glycoprotein C-terminal domain-containing protein n=1 Tax=Acrasis kona TaxID=1008807 RepID=A0AAW2YQE4_9EUKA
MRSRVFLILLFVLSTVLTQESGVRFIFAASGVNAVLKKYIPEYTKVILSTPIPSIHVVQKVAILGDVDFNIENVKINKIDFGDFQANSRSPNVVILGTDTASVSFSLNWSYKQKNWPHASGHGTAEGFAERTQLKGTVFASVKDGIFVFKSDKITLDIGNSKVTIHGGVSGWIANLLEALFRQRIRDAIESSVQNVIVDKIDNTLNEIIRKTNFSPEIKVGTDPKTLNWISDFTIPDNQLFMNDQFLSAAPRFSSRPVRGQSSSMKPVALPDQPVDLNRDVNMFLSDYVFNSFFEALHVGGQLHYPVLPEDVPDYSPIKFNTTNFKLWFPTLYEKYPNAAIRMDVETLNAPTLTFTSQGVKIFANASLQFSARGADGNYQKAFKTAALLNANYLNVTVKSGKEGTLLTFGGKVDANVQLKLIESEIGDVDVTKFNQIINLVALRGAITALNKKLAAGLEVDMTTLGIPGTLVVDDLQFLLHENYVNVNTNATFVPKEILSDNQDALQMLSFMVGEVQRMRNIIGNLKQELEQCHQGEL